MSCFVAAPYCPLLLPVILWPLLTIHQIPGKTWHLLNVQFVPFSFLKALDFLFPSTLLPFPQTLISVMKNAWLFLRSRQRFIFIFVNIIHAEAKFSVGLSSHLSLNCGWTSLFENQTHPAQTNSLWQYLGIWFRANIEWTERLLLSFTSKHQHCRLPIEGDSENTWVCISGTISVEIRWYFIPLSPNLWNKSVFIPSQGHIAMKRAVEWRTMALIYNYNSLPRMMGVHSIHQRQVSA